MFVNSSSTTIAEDLNRTNAFSLSVGNRESVKKKPLSSSFVIVLFVSGVRLATHCINLRVPKSSALLINASKSFRNATLVKQREVFVESRRRAAIKEIATAINLIKIQLVNENEN